MQGFKKITGNPVTQILFCTDPQVSVGIIVDPTGVEADSTGAKVVKAGTPMYGSLIDRDTPFKISTSSVAAKATATVSGSAGLTGADVTAATFSTAVSGASGTYVFTFDGTNWKLDGETATLATYGIAVAELSPGAQDGDTITVVFTAAYNTSPVGVLLHDVDVTDGADNGTCLIFGFVNIDRLDTATAAALQAVASDLDGKVFICKG